MSSHLNNLATLLLMMTSFLSMTSSTTHYLAEVRIFVDESGYSKWMNATGKSEPWEFKREMSSVIYEVNQIFRSLERFGVYLQMEIEDVVIVDTDIVNSTNQMNLLDTTKQFGQWLSSVYTRDPYDLALFFTGRDLPYTYGVALDVGAACTTTGFGIVELHSAFEDVVITTHELGHVFGVEHDGFKSSKDCPRDSGWISNRRINSTHPNRFYFSSCAAENIRNYIANMTRDDVNCLSESSNRKDIVGLRYASLVKTDDELCQRLFGPMSYIDRKKYSSYSSDPCLVVLCVTKTEGNITIWKQIITPEGLDCGKNKQCIQGKCISTSGRSPNISDTCRDQPQIEEDNTTMNCSQMDANKCLKWSQACCQTCQKYSWNPGNVNPGTADDVCRRMAGPGSAMARGAYVTYGDDFCSYLACLTTTVATPWEYFRAPDGMKCGRDKRCRNGRCVFSLHDDKTMTDTCPYGDQHFLQVNTDDNTCHEYTKRYGCHGGVKETCCGSCDDPGTADEVCRKIHGPESAMARYFMGSYGDNLCSKMACLKGFDVFHDHERHQAPDGMKCGKNKRCSHGKCLFSPIGDPNMSDICPYGDQPSLIGNVYSTCKTLVIKGGCTNVSHRWDQACCNSCKKDKKEQRRHYVIENRSYYYLQSSLDSDIYTCEIV